LTHFAIHAVGVHARVPGRIHGVTTSRTTGTANLNDDDDDDDDDRGGEARETTTTTTTTTTEVRDTNHRRRTGARVTSGE